MLRKLCIYPLEVDSVTLRLDVSWKHYVWGQCSVCVHVCQALQGQVADVVCVSFKIAALVGWSNYYIHDVPYYIHEQQQVLIEFMSSS